MSSWSQVSRRTVSKFEQVTPLVSTWLAGGTKGKPQFRPSLVPHWTQTTGWSSGLWSQQPAASAGGPGGQRRQRFAPYLCGTSAPPAAAASSTRISARGGPSRPRPGVYGPLWGRAGRRRGWPASRSPGAVKAKRGCVSARPHECTYY